MGQRNHAPHGVIKKHWTAIGNADDEGQPCCGSDQRVHVGEAVCARGINHAHTVAMRLGGMDPFFNGATDFLKRPGQLGVQPVKCSWTAR